MTLLLPPNLPHRPDEDPGDAPPTVLPSGSAPPADIDERMYDQSLSGDRSNGEDVNGNERMYDMRQWVSQRQIHLMNTTPGSCGMTPHDLIYGTRKSMNKNLLPNGEDGNLPDENLLLKGEDGTESNLNGNLLPNGEEGNLLNENLQSNGEDQDFNIQSFSVQHDKYGAAVAIQPPNKKEQKWPSLGKSKERLQDLAKKGIRKVLITVKTIRRILNFKESIMKYGVFVPKNDSEADASPEHLRWESGRMLEWMRLQDQGTFERNWDWPRIQKKFPTYQRKDIGHIFFVYDFKHSGEHRVRLVFDGSRQNPETYTETYAPTARGESVRLFHVFAVEEGKGGNLFVFSMSLLSKKDGTSHSMTCRRHF